MGLAETLGARAARKGRSAPVECGELGVLTVEALPVRELELLLRGPDGQRAVFYAACRELQSAGEALRKAGKVFTPDGIMQFVSDGEAEAAAEVILALSGETKAEAAKTKREQAGTKADSAGTEQEQVRTKADTAGTKREFRLAPVQLDEGLKNPETEVLPGGKRPLPTHQAEPAAETILNLGGKTKREQAETKVDTASTKREQKRTFRLAPVQKTEAPDPGFGQVSRETMPEIAEIDTVPEADKKAQAMGIFSTERTQNVVPGENMPPAGDGSGEESGAALHETTSEFQEVLHETESEFQGKKQEPVHETESDFGEISRDGLHEIKSEFQRKTPESLHEVTSEFEAQAPQAVHETKSDFGEIRRDGPHEIKSEFGETVHETTSEFRDSLHEMTSEFPEKDPGGLHETTSELAEDVARRLVEGLRRAKWVRGD